MPVGMVRAEQSSEKQNFFWHFFAAMLFMMLATESPLHAQPGTPKPLTKEDVTSLKNIVVTINNFPLLDNADKFIKALKCWVKDSSDEGFGCRRFECQSLDGIELNISITSFHGKVMEYLIHDFSRSTAFFYDTLTNDTARNNSILKLNYIRNWKTFFYSNKPVFEQYKAAVEQELGTIPFDIRTKKNKDIRTIL